MIQAELSAAATFELTVYGSAQPAGSKRAFTPKGWSRAIIVDANAKSKPWKQEIAAAARAAFGREPFQGPLAAKFVFYRHRVKSHFGTGRNAGVLKANAPTFAPTKPDALKLCRAVEDALSGCVYVDDAQICIETIEKRYGADECVRISIWEINPQSS